jgi:hypothetical protein
MFWYWASHMNTIALWHKALQVYTTHSIDTPWVSTQQLISCCYLHFIGLLYRLSDREEWPELVGKVTATGRLIPATTGGVFRVFDALRRLSGR